MPAARILHSATRLPDGRVLVVGGYNRSTQLYDPATEVWSPAPDALNTYRRATATLLLTGQVLVAGAGGSEWNSGISASLYDPGSGSWAATGNLAIPRFHHSSTLLRDGRVLVVGGADNEYGGNVLTQAELYDPTLGSWAPVAALASARRNHTATLLGDGKVLITGGTNSSGERQSTAEVYDPSTGQWSPVANMVVPRAYHSATLLADGRVLVAGGGGSDWASGSSAEVFDPASGIWTATGAMNTPRRFHTATLLPSGQVLVAGGFHEYTGISFTAELYEPATHAWNSTASMNTDRHGHAAVLLKDGSVLAVGGFSNHDQASAELFLTGPRAQLPVGTSLLLEVVDGAGQAISSAAVSAPSMLLPTDSSGHLLLENLQPGHFLARVDAPGFTSASVSLELSQGAHAGYRVRLLPLGAPHLLQAEQGGSIDTGSVRVTLMPGSVMDALGQPVTGPIEVTVVPLDPSTQMGSMPGPLEGTTASSNEPTQLESFFMAEVGLWRNGAPLQLAPNKVAILEFTLPDAVASRFHEGDTAPAWWFDLEAGLWRQEGLGVVRPSSSQPGKLTWTIHVRHFTWWNCDMPRLVTFANVHVVDSHGNPVPHASVTSVGTSYQSSSQRVADSAGHLCVPIMVGGTATLYAGPLGSPVSPPVSVTGSTEPAACDSAAATPVTLVVQERICAPGAYRECPYSGPAGTRGKGVCRAGLQRCDILGSEWSACQGEVVPAAAESCQTAFDDDCDGLVNEECVCAVESGLSCYTGPAGTQGVGRCMAGVTGCGPTGAIACLGQQLPLKEDCSTPEDDDCDGSTACPDFKDAQSVGGTGNDSPWAVALDGSGNALLLAQGEGTLNLGGALVTLDPKDLFVEKLSPAGEHLWHVRIQRADVSTNTLRDSKNALTVDGAGNVLIASSFVTQVSIGDTTRTSPSASGVIIVKLSPTGSLLWAQAFSGTATSAAGVTGITTDSSGDVVAAGNFSGDLQVGDQWYPTLGGNPFYVLKLQGSTGTPIWSKVYRNGTLQDVSMDEAQNVLLAGDFYTTTLDLDGTQYGNGPANRNDGFIAKLDATTGTHFWSMQIINTYYASGWQTTAARADGAGNVLLLTKFDMFRARLKKISPARSDIWNIDRINVDLPISQFAGGPQLGMTVDSAGNTWLAGALQPSDRASNAFFMKYDKDGGARGASVYGMKIPAPPGGTAQGVAVATNAAGKRVFVGRFNGTVDFGSGFVTSRGSGFAQDDIFLLRFAP